MIHKAKKSLGQNFLKSKSALSAMVKSAELFGSDTVLEIGPGKGALTEYLLKSSKKVIAVEKDHNLCEILSEKFGASIADGKLILINGDILEFDPALFTLKERGYKVVANIPYNITGAIIKKFLTEKIFPESMTLLVQKEVADRIVARDGKESVLSISVKAYGAPHYMMKVSKKFFSPAPKVDSAIIHISNISKDNFAPTPSPLKHSPSDGERMDMEEKFFQIVKAGFAHKRKVLKKNLEAVLEKEKINEIFKKLNLNEKSRAEELAIDKWLEITK